MALVACGGGGSSDTTTPPVTSTDVTIAGTAATGAAIAAGTVTVKCAAGAGTPTTGTDGKLSIKITSAALPCALRVTQGSTVLHSMVESGAGATVTANITPLSELLMAKVTGGSPAALFTSFDATTQAKITAAALAAARAAVVAAFVGVVDLSGIDPIKDALVAANGSTTGNTLDQKLDALKAVLLAAQTTLAELTAAVAAGAPVQTIVQATSSSCAGLRSGRYRVVDPAATDPAWATHIETINAATLAVTHPDNTTGTLTSTGGCTFTGADGVTAILVAKSGVAVARSPLPAPSTSRTTAILLPEQTIPLAELAGTWNLLSYNRDNGTAPYAPGQSYFTVDASGKFSNGFECSGLAACTGWIAPLPGDITASTDGGFSFIDAGATNKFYVFKAADGRLVAVGLQPNNSGFWVGSKQATLTLPAVGDVNNFWDFSVNSSGFASVVTDTTTTVTAVDSVAQSYTRSRTSDGRVDGFSINNPRSGLRYRAAGTSPITGGGTVNYSEIIVLPLGASIGVSVYTSAGASQNFFGISVGKP